MDRTERFYKIEMLIRHRGCVSFAALQQELEVSRATLNRDLLYLRSRMDAPIVYDRADNGYRFAADGRDGRQAAHQLPGVWFSEREIHALLTMHRLIRGLDDEGVLGRHLQPMLDKLHGMLGESEGQSQELVKRVKIIGAAKRPVPGRFFELVGGALVRRRRIRLRYFTRGRKTYSEREVSPLRLVHYRNTWYLDAWCHRSQALRRFALDAFEDATVLEKKARDVALKTVEAELDGGYGIFSGKSTRTVTLLFSADAARWVSREEWHPDQTARWLDDGCYELELPFSDPTELIMDVLRHGPQVVVLRPAELRDAVTRALQQALDAYRSEASAPTCGKLPRFSTTASSDAENPPPACV